MKRTLSLGLSALLVACGQPPATAKPTPRVLVETLGDTATHSTFIYSGEVRARHETPLAFQVSGRVRERLVERGQHVSAGQALLRVDPRDLDQAMAQSAAGQIAARADFKLAERNLAQFQPLFKQGFVSQAELDRHHANFEDAKARLQQADAALAVGRNQREYATLLAPHDGVIAEVNAEPGQVVSAGAPAVVLVREGEREVEISVPEQRVEAFKQARHYQIGIWALPGIKLTGKLREISPSADRQTRTYAARLGLVDAPAAVQLGMTASVTSAEGTARALTVPLTAIYQKESQPNVWVVRAAKAVLVPVTLGAPQGERVVVRTGLQAGDQVVVAGTHKLVAGMAVEGISGSAAQ
ncbi:efflux RND transporter periplasmic adaptor subunit [Chitinimonas arctica]|uniref:Efflux RND transporter periplasmic adaptor subunit n=1 Tax=Chitinimonas arctica TaxID=2594795 RepID=A0A516SLS8_9NEIS|nr:efflux RND transporter periplasmic adaptor subunit [Chitinimonas arctica]QDQ29116.1 efflux RND transporter periplasmic adaptor subunit [Chitinimonas arctica]